MRTPQSTAIACFALLFGSAAAAEESAEDKEEDKGAEVAKAASEAKAGKPARDADDEEAGHGAGYRLPGGIHLGGMFDVAYERDSRSAELGSGKNAFRSYHRLLFLSRQGDDVPVGFNAELLNQYFYELSTRLSAPGSPLRVLAHAGKILVPFGPDPLFHKSYGGLTGADQRTLPVVWSSIGAGVRASFMTRGFAATDEVYAVQGFDLASADQTLNMQRDLASYDGARIAFGNRLALSTGPVSAWYSFYWNQMRFGRLLVMQAVDVSLWRPALPLLNRLAVGAGFVRAHVSATADYGKPGAAPDASAYFHFADYVWVRLYLVDGLYLQGRSGLATFDNRRGLTYDANRADPTDGSHHTASLVYDYASAQVMLAYYWNFEKVDERPDDLLRLMVTYAF